MMEPNNEGDLAYLTKEFGRRGGKATLAKYGPKHFSKLGKIAKRKRKNKHDKKD